jgi:hypothetical protein
MNNRFAGIAQHREHRGTLPEVAGETPAPRSTFAQALFAAFPRDEAALAAGRRDGAHGRGFAPGNFDMFSYASGYREGRQFPSLNRRA